MKPAPLPRVVAAVDLLPQGTVTGRMAGRRYVATKTLFNAGRSIKLVAEELGGPDYISLNIYRLSQGPRLFPCEMSHAKVCDFVLHFAPDQAGG